MKIRWGQLAALFIGALFVHALVAALPAHALAGEDALFISAQSGTEKGGEVQTLEVKIDQPKEVKWEAAIAMGKTWYVDDPPAFLIGTRPGQGDIVKVEVTQGYEQRQGSFQAAPGTYYITARAGHGIRNAAGDIREFHVFGHVRGWIGF